MGTVKDGGTRATSPFANVTYSRVTINRRIRREYDLYTTGGVS